MTRIIETAAFADSIVSSEFTFHLVSRDGRYGWVSDHDLPFINERTVTGWMIDLLPEDTHLGERVNASRHA